VNQQTVNVPLHLNSVDDCYANRKDHGDDQENS